MQTHILEALADTQRGVVMRQQAIDAGLRPDDIDFLLKRGEWVSLRRGAYVSRDRLEQMDDAQRHLARIHAVARSLAQPAVVSHTSAALLHGLPDWNIGHSDVHVSRGNLRSPRTESGVHHHTGELRPDDVVEIDGIQVTSLARTVIDTARITPFEESVCIADAAFNRDPDLQQATLTRLDQVRDWPGARNAGAVVEFANGLSQSVGESRTRVKFRDVDLPEPELQVQIRDDIGHLLGIADFLFKAQRTITEFDGRAKYSRYLRPGQDPGDVLWREKQREDALRALGFEVVRLIWADLDVPHLIKKKVLDAFARAAQRSGGVYVA